MDYAKKAQDVLKKLTLYGADIELSSVSVITDPFTGATVTNPGETFTAKALRTDWTEKDLRNTLIEATDSKVMIDAVNGVPKKGMTATFNGVTYSVVEVMPFSPAGIAVHYYLALRV